MQMPGWARGLRSTVVALQIYAAPYQINLVFNAMRHWDVLRLRRAMSGMLDQPLGSIQVWGIEAIAHMSRSGDYTPRFRTIRWALTWGTWFSTMGPVMIKSNSGEPTEKRRFPPR